MAWLMMSLYMVLVLQEKKGIFKTYTIINTAAVFAAFSTAAALIIVSGLKRETAITQCQSVSPPIQLQTDRLKLLHI